MKRIFQKLRNGKGNKEASGVQGIRDHTFDQSPAVDKYEEDNAQPQSRLPLDKGVPMDEDDEDASIMYEVGEDQDMDDSVYTNTEQQISKNQQVYGQVESYFSGDNRNNSVPGGSSIPNNHVPQKHNAGPSRITTKTVVHIPAPCNEHSPSKISCDDENHRCTETRNLVKQFIADIWNRGDLEMIPSVCSPSLRFNGNTGFDRVGHDGLARMVTTIREALDEYHCEIHSMVVENNKAFCRLRFTGKHVGALLGYTPTHKTVAWMGATEFTCQNSKILKVWELGDVKSLEKQLKGDSTSDL